MPGRPGADAPLPDPTGDADLADPVRPDRQDAGANAGDDRLDEHVHRPGPVHRVVDAAGAVVDAAGAVVGAADAVVDAAEPVIERVGGAVGRAARRLPLARPSRQRALRRRARLPLPSLWEVHPDASRGRPRALGLRSVPVEEIVGTAVEGPAQRGGDFLPLPTHRTTNWEIRWQRIQDAVQRLAVLPPVDLVRFGDGYWVEDGHNRVAAALYNGQVAVDAAVRELRLPGVRSTERPENVAAMLAGGGYVKAAGEGRLTRSTLEHEENLPEDVRSGPPVDAAPHRADGEREPRS